MALLATTWSPETAKTSAASSIEGGAFSGWLERKLRRPQNSTGCPLFCGEHGLKGRRPLCLLLKSHLASMVVTKENKERILFANAMSDHIFDLDPPCLWHFEWLWGCLFIYSSNHLSISFMLILYHIPNS
jgi:hypothetical protein